MRPNDRYVHALNFTLFVGGPDVIGAQNLGALCIWAGAIPSDRLLFILKEFQPTVIWTTPSYAWYLGKLRKNRELTLQRTFPSTKSLWQESREALLMPQGKPLRSFGMQKSTISTEFRTFSEHARECAARETVFIWWRTYSGGSYQSRYFRAGCGRRKRELVFTTLRKTARPMIRFRTGDIGTVNREKCACGRTHARINITGRLDDMLIVSGVNVFPSDIEYVVRNMEELSGEYRITAITENFTTKFKLEVGGRSETRSPKKCLQRKYQPE